MRDVDRREDVERQEAEVAALAALAEPLRRRLYLHVNAAGSPVGRDAAAEAVGVPRSVAAFHLDKLAEVGLLAVEYRRPEGRGGPGAGRPAKLYRRADGDITFAAPVRRYDVAASLLVRALAEADGREAPVVEALGRVAAEEGRAIGAPLAGTSEMDRDELIGRLIEVLAARGYEPALAGDTVVLHNCPFRALAEEQHDLVCGMNLALVEGMVEEADDARLSARLDPAPGCCCVTITVA